MRDIPTDGFLTPTAAFNWGEPRAVLKCYKRKGNDNRLDKENIKKDKKKHNMFGTAMIPAPAPIYDERDLADLAEDFRRSKESLKAAGRRLTSRQTSRATRASRASAESRGPLSSNEDLDLHVDLPPGILADESAASSPPSRPPGHPPGKAARKTKRSSTSRSERKIQRDTGALPLKRRRGFRARLRRLFGRGDKPEAVFDALYSQPDTQESQKQDHQDENARQSTEQKAAPKLICLQPKSPHLTPASIPPKAMST
ncbi:OPT family small oligopeptide transporter [Colletotrichum tofieldiae]|nr:OPT family small oligopeptide transporter [Colletotrichum tofieldiae]